MSKKLVLHSGGQDSLALMLKYVEECGEDNVISLGFNYGQRHFEQENAAAMRFCDDYIERHVLNIPIDQIGGCSLIDKNVDVTTDMTQQRSTVVPQRNAIFLMFAAAFAQENNCDVIVHGACREDYAAYRDCRPVFFSLMESVIQAGRTNPIKGSEDVLQDIVGIGAIPVDRLDIRIETPLINKTKIQIVKQITETFEIDVYRDSYTCYNGGLKQCGKCPACIERIESFRQNGLIDPLQYEINIDWNETKA